MNNALLSVLALTIAAGCTADTPTAPMQSSGDPAGRALVSADLAGGAELAAASCQTVHGTITANVVPGQAAAGLIHGDLEGTITTVLVPDPVGATDKFVTGAATHLTGQQTVEVQGSSIPDLVGRTVVWLLDSRAEGVLPILRVSNTLRIVQGATGNLASHGTLDQTTLTTHFDYDGVICP